MMYPTLPLVDLYFDQHIMLCELKSPTKIYGEATDLTDFAWNGVVGVRYIYSKLLFYWGKKVTLLLLLGWYLLGVAHDIFLLK